MYNIINYNAKNLREITNYNHIIIETSKSS